MLLQYGWTGSVGFSTGNKPLVMLSDSYYHAEKPAFTRDVTFSGTLISG